MVVELYDIDINVLNECFWSLYRASYENNESKWEHADILIYVI